MRQSLHQKTTLGKTEKPLQDTNLFKKTENPFKIRQRCANISFLGAKFLKNHVQLIDKFKLYSNVTSI